MFELVLPEAEPLAELVFELFPLTSVPLLPEVAGARPESDEESEGAFSAPESLSTFELSAELEVFEPFPLIFVPSLPEVAGAIPEPLFEEVFELVEPF